MAQIVAIERLRGRPARVRLHLAGGERIDLVAEVAERARLAEGAHLADGELAALHRESEERRALEIAGRQLGQRPRSAAELRRALARRGVPEAVQIEVIARLARHGLVDDQRFAQEWVAQRAAGRRPLGPDRLAAELRERGVAGEIVAEAVAALAPEQELEQARAVAQARWPRYRQYPRPDGERRLAALLRRRGFTWATIRQVVREIAGAEVDPAP